MSRTLLVALALYVTTAAQAQEGTATVRVRVLQDSLPAIGVSVRSGAVALRTNLRGEVVLALPAGERVVVASRVGLRPDSLRLVLAAGADTSVVLALDGLAEEVERIIVMSTREDRRIEDVPLRVEVLAREEVEEKMLMTPGDISMMLNETGGLRVQTTSPSLGGANVRVQGLRGRYTLMLSDGLPLNGGQTGSLGLLQIPPMDLGQVEVIKGVASALYGSSALGGVVNLISRRPRVEPEREVLINATSRQGADFVLWDARRMSERFGYTLLAGAHTQERRDIDGDGWTDMAGYDRVVARPRAFWNGKNGRNAIATIGVTSERRRGGTMPGHLAPDGFAFVEGLTTRHLDAGGVLKLPFASGVFSARASGSSNDHRHHFGAQEHDRHDTWFSEASVSAARGVTSGVIGAALQFERFSSADVARFNYRYTIPAVFAQLDVDAGGWFAASASARADAHSRYGTVLNPRLSLLLRAPHQWTARLSAGTGAFAPTPLTEETEATGLSPMAVFPALNVERGRGASLDVGGKLGAFELNGTLFASRITDALAIRPVSGSPGAIEMFNATLPTYASGADALARHRLGDVVTTISYTHVRSTEESPALMVRRAVPLTPRHSAGLVSVWERAGVQRIGIEVYYTGRQSLDDNPYLVESKAYVLFGAIAERRVGRARVFVNLENLGDTRMTRHQPLVRSTPGPGGRWTTDAWGPLEGRTINAGIRMNAITSNAERTSPLSRLRNQ